MMDAVVVWNGALDRAWALAQQRTPTAEDQPKLRVDVAIPEAASPRTSDRVYAFLMANPQVEHTAHALGELFDISVHHASSYLRRMLERGQVQVVGRTLTRGRPCWVYRVRREAQS